MITPRILYSDLSTVTYTASEPTQSDGNPLNLKTGWPTDMWVSATTASVQWLGIDLGSASPCNYVLIDGHNLDSLMISGSIYLQAATNSSYTTGLENVVALQVSLDAQAARPPIVFSPFTSVSKRYWRLFFSGSMIEPPRIGTIYVGKSLDFQFPEKLSAKKEAVRFSTVTKTSVNGRQLTSANYGGRLSYEVPFPEQNNTFRTDFQSFYTTIKGKLNPFYYYSEPEIRYMKLDSDYSPVEVKRFGQNAINTLTMKSVETSKNWYQAETIPEASEISDDYIYMDY